MNLLTLKYYKIYEFLDNIKSENLGFYFSFILHLFILLFAIGLPNFFDPKPIMIPTIIPIEIINVSEITSMPKEVKKLKSAEPKQSKIKEKKFNSSNNQEIKKIDIKDKSRIKENFIEEKKIILKENTLVKEKKIISVELEKEKIIKEVINFEKIPTKKIKPKLKPNLKPKKEVMQQTLKSDVSIQSKPKLSLKPKDNSEAKLKPKAKPNNEFNIASMLKDLRNEKSIAKVEGEEKKENINQTKELESPEPTQLSISEIDLVLQQLSRCFIAPAGAEIKKTMFVKISAKIQQNRRVHESSIRIVDTNISKSSSVYGPITESAMRTLLNPECIPLKLPEDKYSLWKNLTMKFDYSVMKGN